jgi:hypothetical protein
MYLAQEQEHLFQNNKFLDKSLELARKEFLKMREKHEENKIRNKKVASEVKPMVDEKFIAEVREQIYKNLQKISEQKKLRKKHQQTQKNKKE